MQNVYIVHVMHNDSYAAFSSLELAQQYVKNRIQNLFDTSGLDAEDIGEGFSFELPCVDLVEAWGSFWDTEEDMQVHLVELPLDNQLG